MIFIKYQKLLDIPVFHRNLISIEWNFVYTLLGFFCFCWSFHVDDEVLRCLNKFSNIICLIVAFWIWVVSYDDLIAVLSMRELHQLVSKYLLSKSKVVARCKIFDRIFWREDKLFKALSLSIKTHNCCK